MSSSITSSSSDLTSELLLNMRLFSVQFGRIGIKPTLGVGFSNAVGRAQFHFVGRGPVWLRAPGGTVHALDTGDALLIPRGGPHAMLFTPDTADAQVMTFDPAGQLGHAYTAHKQVDTAEPSHDAVIFSCCMEFDLGGMQPLINAMPEVMLVNTLLASSPEIPPMLDAMERESMAQQAGHAGILARLAEVVAALIVRRWVANGCGNATGWVGALHDPRLSRAIVMMHKAPGRNWTVAELAKEAGNSRSVFSQRFSLATGVSPLRYLRDLRMRLAVHSLGRNNQPVETVARQLGYGSLAAFSRAFKRSVGTSPGAVRAEHGMTR